MSSSETTVIDSAVRAASARSARGFETGRRSSSPTAAASIRPTSPGRRHACSANGPCASPPTAPAIPSVIARWRSKRPAGSGFATRSFGPPSSRIPPTARTTPIAAITASTSCSRTCRRLPHERGFAAVADGNNADDRGDYRPGRRAAREFGVISPLDDAGLTKDDIRAAVARSGAPVLGRAGVGVSVVAHSVLLRGDRGEAAGDRASGAGAARARLPRASRAPSRRRRAHRVRPRRDGARGRARDGHPHRQRAPRPSDSSSSRSTCRATAWAV